MSVQEALITVLTDVQTHWDRSDVHAMLDIDWPAMEYLAMVSPHEILYM